MLQYNLQFYVFNQVKCKESYEEKKIYISRERETHRLSLLELLAINLGTWENGKMINRHFVVSESHTNSTNKDF